jgi:cyclic lactone autoinducer peptide
MEYLVELFAKVAETIANTGSNACLFWHIDEPKCPESLIK